MLILYLPYWILIIIWKWKIKKEILVPEDYEELLESFLKKFKANNKNTYNFNYVDQFGQEHTLKEKEICPSIFDEIKELIVECEDGGNEPNPPSKDEHKKKIEQMKLNYEKQKKRLQEKYEQKINDYENQIKNLNQKNENLQNQINELKLQLEKDKEKRGDEALTVIKEKIEEFRKEFNLNSNIYKDEKLLKVLFENNFNNSKAFDKLFD